MTRVFFITFLLGFLFINCAVIYNVHGKVENDEWQEITVPKVQGQAIEQNKSNKPDTNIKPTVDPKKLPKLPDLIQTPTQPTTKSNNKSNDADIEETLKDKLKSKVKSVELNVSKEQDLKKTNNDSLKNIPESEETEEKLSKILEPEKEDFIYRPRSKKSRKVYDYRNAIPSKYFQKNLPNEQNTHLPNIVYKQELSQMLFSAIATESLPGINELLKRGADINAKTMESGFTPLMIAVKMNKIQSIRYLIAKGADISIQDKNGRTSLHLAAMNDFFRIYEILIQSGIDSNIKDNNGYTATDYVNPSLQDRYYVVIAKHIRDKEKSLLSLVAKGSFAAVSYLIEQGSDIDQADENGDTSLIIATKKQNSKMVGLLLAKGANFELKNKNGLDAREIAKQNKDQQSLILLETVIVKKELETEPNILSQNVGIEDKKIVENDIINKQNTLQSHIVTAPNKKENNAAPKIKPKITEVIEPGESISAESKNSEASNWFSDEKGAEIRQNYNNIIEEGRIKEITTSEEESGNSIKLKELFDKEEGNKLVTTTDPAKESINTIPMSPEEPISIIPKSFE